MTPQEAMIELRNGATHGQLDPDLVESFVAVLMREDPVATMQQAQEADFETELEFERRVQEMARPPASDPTSHPARPARPHSRGRKWRADVLSLRQRVLNKE
jgi:hypothetical protein